MAGQFDKETNRQNFEWHRERALREKKSANPYSQGRVVYNLKAIEKKHGEKAAKEVAKEYMSKIKTSSRKYYS